MPEDAEVRTSNLAPGMESIVMAGDTLVITDKEGQEFAVTARESEEVMSFLKAFDEWFFAKQKSYSDGILSALWSNLQTQFNNLPMRIQRDLPSFKTMGVTVRAHDHA